MGPGVHVGKRAKIGVGCVLGVKTVVNDGGEVGPCARLEHGIIIGEGARVGPASLIGYGSTVGAKVKLPFGCRIPRITFLREQEDVKQYASRELKT